MDSEGQTRRVQVKSRKTVEPQGFSGIIARGAQCPGERGEQNAERIREEIIGWLDNRGTGALAFSLNSRGDILLEKNVLFFFTFYPLSLFASICPLLLFPENARRILCVCVSLCVFVCMPFPPPLLPLLSSKDESSHSVSRGAG